MPSYVTPKKNTQYIFYISLVSQADTKLMKSSPTIASGDFKVSTDGGTLANLGTLPVVTPAASVMVKITLSTSEMNGDNITVVCIDAAGAEWCDQVINIQTSARQIDDLAYPATSGRSMVVDASGLVDANAVKLGPTGAGTAQTARDIGTSVLLSAGTGTGQLDFTAGITKSNLSQILGTALTETAGLLAGGFKKFFNVATPTGTLNSIPDAVAGAAAGLFIAGSNAATTVNFTGNLSGSVGSLTTNNDKTGYGLSSAAVQAIWDALTSALTTAGSIGKKLADWVIGTTQTGDSFVRLGAPAGASVSADIAAIKAQVVTINADTDDIQTRLPAALIGGKMDSNLSSSSDTPGTTTLLSRLTSGRATNLDNLDATVSSRATPAQIQSSVAAELDAAGAELSTVPTTTGTLRQKINYVFQYFRNRRTMTATVETLYKEDAVSTLGTATVSNNGTTATHGEVS